MQHGRVGVLTDRLPRRQHPVQTGQAANFCCRSMQVGVAAIGNLGIIFGRFGQHHRIAHVDHPRCFRQQEPGSHSRSRSIEPDFQIRRLGLLHNGIGVGRIGLKDDVGGQGGLHV